MQLRLTPRGVLRLVAVVATLSAIVLHGPVPGPHAQQLGGSSDTIWELLADRPSGQSGRTDIEGQSAVFAMDLFQFRARVAEAGADRYAMSRSVELALPMPDGRLLRFAVKESPILDDALAAAFPEIRTYSAQGIDDPTATARFDWTYHGFHAMVFTSAYGAVMIDPYTVGRLDTYVAFRKSDFRKPGEIWTCWVGGEHTEEAHRLESEFPISHGSELRTYRLALAATAEYTAAAGGVAGAVSRITTTMNRVNGIYERQLAVRMTVATGTALDPTALIYTDANTDPYSNFDGSAMLAQNQSNLDTVITSANYDIGHVFSTGGGGIATLRSPCSPSTKARGVTGSSNPTGDAFDVDYVAHEIGHQFGGNHTFNGTSSACGGGSRSAAHAYEIGSGVTIQAYAGICSVENLQPNSIDRFHVESLNEMTAFLTSGGGSSCGTTTSIGNVVPVVSAGADYTVPAGTPFMLTATGSDANGDTLTYAWDQYSRGLTATSSVATAAADGGSNPLFRSYSASTSPSRMFPSLTYILNNDNLPPTTYSCGGSTCLVGEVMPTSNRAIDFVVTAHDNRSGGGAIKTDTATVTISPSMGPFRITSQNSGAIVAGRSALVVTWDVAGTSAITPNVRITMSTDGGVTFPVELVASTPNDGSHTVTVPNTATSAARIKVEAVGNIYFDINNAALTITVTARAVNDYDGDGRSDVSVYRPTTGRWDILGSGGSNLGVTWGTELDVPVAGDFDGDGKSDPAVFRPSTGMWYVLNSSTGFATSTSHSWGAEGDIPLEGDFDGDGKADPAVFRPATGAWYVRQSSSGSTLSRTWGAGTDVAVPADYDGDAKADIAVYRPASGTWFILTSLSGFTSSTTGVWGIRTDVPVPADYDGDGKADLSVFRPSTGAWYINQSLGGTLTRTWGASTDVPVLADFDGDQKADISVWRAETGTSYILRSSTGFSTSTTSVWGSRRDRPLGAVARRTEATSRADYDGDRRADITVYRSSNGAWYVLRSGTVFSSSYAHIWGTAIDTPVRGDYDGDGIDDVAVYRPSTGAWYILSSQSGFLSSLSRVWGTSDDVPVPGDYDGDGSTDIAVYRPSTGAWYILTSSSTFLSSRGYSWGTSGDIPAPADFDGDGVSDLVVWRPSTGTWYVGFSGTGFTSSTGRIWGAADDVPVPGDYDGDGLADFAVYRPSTGVWYVLTSSSGFNETLSRSWGSSIDRAVPADYDGDGRTDIAVFRPSTGGWYVLKSNGGFLTSFFTTWGGSGDIPPMRRE